LVFPTLLQERPSSKERELVFEAVTATMKQLKGSYSVISLISQASKCHDQRKS
jgi:glucosamine 6-phosphate synthetase-like amidotransferase/phosphosugar isomerase protein